MKGSFSSKKPSRVEGSKGQRRWVGVLFSHRALQQWKQKQLDGNKEAAGEVTISEGKFLGHPHNTFSVWFKLGNKHMAQYDINGVL